VFLQKQRSKVIQSFAILGSCLRRSTGAANAPKSVIPHRAATALKVDVSWAVNHQRVADNAIKARLS
jgi:uncharacterized lipoprotein YajG